VNDYPYLEKDGQCRIKSDNTRAFISGVINVTPFSQLSLMTSLALLGPVATGICGTDQAFLYYQSGIFTKQDCCHELNHAVLIVGYGHDDKLDLDYWTIQNSWGTLWGENGFMRIARL
jgi:cathepsin L